MKTLCRFATIKVGAITDNTEKEMKRNSGKEASRSSWKRVSDVTLGGGGGGGQNRR